MKSKFSMVVLFLCSLAVVAQQQRRELHGRVKSGDAVLPGLFVINNITGAETKTDSKGNFTLLVKPGDRIAVYGKSIEVREFAISEASLRDNPYILSVEISTAELEELKINYISAESLGIVPKGQKQYTVAERRLKTAGEFKPTFMFLLMGGISMPLDPIINAISGRTKMLKKNLATERKEFGIEGINSIYTPAQITEKLHIPAELVNGFVFYAVEDPECAEAIRVKNNELVKLRLMVLAEKYLKLQQGDAVPQQTTQTSRP